MKLSDTDISATFDFHGVETIRIGKEEACKYFVTRNIHLIDRDGKEIIITCFNNGTEEAPDHRLPVA